MAEASYILADLPSSLAGSGDILVADVHTIAGGTKKKRSELAVAIDNESLNLYNIRSSKLTASYAISPLAVFTCPPCSIRYRRKSLEITSRLTYCSIKSPKPKLLCFSETSGKNASSGRQISISSVDLPLSKSPIVCVDIISGGGGRSKDTCSNLYHFAIHENGDVRCHSADLTTQLWMVSALSKDSKEDITRDWKVQYAIVLDLDQAKRAILKDREDILAQLASSIDTFDVHILLLFTRPTNPGQGLSLQVFALRTGIANPEAATVAVGRQPLQALLSLSIPEPNNVEWKGSKSAFHAASGTLHQYSPNALSEYSLVGMVARRIHYTDLSHTSIETCLRLSSSLAAVNTATSVSVIDTQYNSLQAEFLLKNHTLQRREDGPNEATSTRLLSYFAPLDLIVALQGRRLIAIQLSNSSVRENSRKRARNGSLLSSIGRGIVPISSKLANKPAIKLPKSLGTYLFSPHSDKDWIRQKTSLDQLSAIGEFGQFQALITSELGIEFKEKTNDPTKKLRRSIPDQHRIQYLLSKIFSLDLLPSASGQDNASRKLKIRFWSIDIFRYLLRNGLVSVDVIETSLKHHGSLPLTDRITPGALIQALAEWDPSLEILLSLVESPVPLKAEELAHALKYCMSLTRSTENSDSFGLITNGELGSDSVSDHNMQLISDTPSSSNPPLTNADKLSVVHRLLDFTISRLAHHSLKTITSALRATLSPPILLQLIDHLRVSLARAGWLTPYTESLPSLPPAHGVDYTLKSNLNNPQISTIAKLLNCLLDALGSASWLASTSPADGVTSDTADTIAYMKAEISAALEGVEEATYLRGMLGEILLYAASYSTSQEKKDADRRKRIKAAAAPPRTITTIPLPADKGPLGNALPLGLKASQGIAATKVGAGGEVMERSRRDIGRLKDRDVPTYSFERITV